MPETCLVTEIRLDYECIHRENEIMLATRETLQDFTTFANQQISARPECSMRELFREWLELREQTEVIAAMEESDADIAAGRVTPVHEAFDEVRAKLGIKK